MNNNLPDILSKTKKIASIPVLNKDSATSKRNLNKKSPTKKKTPTKKVQSPKKKTCESPTKKSPSKQHSEVISRYVVEQDKTSSISPTKEKKVDRNARFASTKSFTTKQPPFSKSLLTHECASKFLENNVPYDKKFSLQKIKKLHGIASSNDKKLSPTKSNNNSNNKTTTARSSNKYKSITSNDSFSDLSTINTSKCTKETKKTKKSPNKSPKLNSSDQQQSTEYSSSSTASNATTPILMEHVILHSKIDESNVSILSQKDVIDVTATPNHSHDLIGNTTTPNNLNENDSIEFLTHDAYDQSSSMLLINENIVDDSSESILLNSTASLDPDVMRWENQCSDPVEEIERIEIYKLNRRLRYMNANNNKIALLKIKDKTLNQN